MGHDPAHRAPHRRDGAAVRMVHAQHSGLQRSRDELRQGAREDAQRGVAAHHVEDVAGIDESKEELEEIIDIYTVIFG